MGRTKKAIKLLENEIKTMSSGAYEFVLGQITFAYKMGLITEEEETELRQCLRAKSELLRSMEA